MKLYASARLKSLESIESASGSPLTKKQKEVVDFIKHQINIDLSGVASKRGSNKWFNVDVSDPAIKSKLRQIESLGYSSGKFRLEPNGASGYAFFLTTP